LVGFHATTFHHANTVCVVADLAHLAARIFDAWNAVVAAHQLATIALDAAVGANAVKAKRLLNHAVKGAYHVVQEDSESTPSLSRAFYHCAVSGAGVALGKSWGA
jgi:hypothetical protein